MLVHRLPEMTDGLIQNNLSELADFRLAYCAVTIRDGQDLSISGKEVMFRYRLFS